MLVFLACLFACCAYKEETKDEKFLLCGGASTVIEVSILLLGIFMLFRTSAQINLFFCLICVYCITKIMIIQKSLPDLVLTVDNTLSLKQDNEKVDKAMTIHDVTNKVSNHCV